MKEEEICSPTTQGSRNITIGTYLYDETDRMVQGTNKDGEASLYTFNGLGVRVGSELILEDNTHGYTDFHCLTPSIETTVGGPQGPEVVKADYVIDYTRLNIDQRVLMKLEEGGYDFRYVYGLDKIQVTVNSEGSNWWGQNIKPCVMMNYVHTDRLGSVVNLSDQYGRVTARVDYDDWGKVTAYTDITVDGGFRRLLPEITYATHEYDDVLDMFYAKARMYDADNRRFAAVDPILEPSIYKVKWYVDNSIRLVQYPYVRNNPTNLVDPTGKVAIVDDAVVVYFAGGTILTFTYAKWVEWVNSPEGQEALTNATKVVVNGVTYVGEGISKLLTSLVDGAQWIGGKVVEGATWAGGKVVEGATWAGGKVVEGATWVGAKVSSTWNSITSYFDKHICEDEEDVPLPNQGTVEGPVEGAPPVDAGKQGKHVPGHNNNDSTKSQWKKGETGVKETQEAWEKGTELPDGTKVWDTGKPVGQNGETGVRVHIDSKGRIHGYPVDPQQYLK